MRYHPLTDADRGAMLARIGASDIGDLFVDIPEGLLRQPGMQLDKGKSELDVERHFSKLAKKNLSAAEAPCFIGAGAYLHHVPASVDHLIQRSEFLTSYTPYQAEISQGTLQYLFEFQTQVALLTGMDVANASMYDGSTACAEAMLMAHRVTRRNKAILSGGLHPQYAEVCETIARLAGDVTLRMAPDVIAQEDLIAKIDDSVSCVIVQSPDFFGTPRALDAIADACHKHGALLIAVFTEAVSLGLLTPPGAQGADIVVGEGQSFGNALSFGGPYVGLFATRNEYLRQMPGRLAGETIDATGRRGFVLTLSTREQHIRRDKATSNICTNSGLCSLAFTIHLTLLGEKGLARLARKNHANAIELADMLAEVKGVDVLNTAFFNEFTLRLPGDAAEFVERMAARGVLAGMPVSRLLPNQGLDDLLLVANTEMNTRQDRETFVAELAGAL
jgi:glycine dehydrogenase subunit 1